MQQPKLRFKEFNEKWKLVKLGNFLSFIGSGVTPRGGSSVYQKKEGVILVRSQNVHFSGLKLNDIAFITHEINEKMKKSEVQNLDVLLNITGASIGRTAMVPIGFPKANVNQHVCILRPNNQIAPFFLKTFLESSKGQRNVFKDQAGQTREALNLQQIKDFSLGIPQKDEQQKLSAFFMLLDKRIEKQKEKIEKLEQFKKGIIQKVFSQELRFKNGNGAYFGKWETKTLMELGDFNKSYSFSRNNEGEGEYFHVHYGDIHTKLDSIIDNATQLPSIDIVSDLEEIEVGDVLFADASEDYKDLGKAVVVTDIEARKIVAGLHTHRFKPSSQIDSVYLMYFTKTKSYSTFIKKYGTGVSVLGISKKNLGTCEVPVPSKAEQRKISEVFLSIDNKIKKEKEKLFVLKEQKNGFMQKMFI